MISDSLKLLNCRRCDDVVKLVEEETRFCECRASSGRLNNGHVVASATARVFEISWEAYDGIAEGETRAFGVVPRNRY